MIADPERKAYYKRIAHKLKLPNAYTAAITDYMRKIQIPEVTVSDKVQIEVFKKDFKVETVNIVITDPDLRVIEQGSARLKGYEFWWYHPATVNLHDLPSYRIIITASDRTGQQIEKIAEKMRIDS